MSYKELQKMCEQKRVEANALFQYYAGKVIAADIKKYMATHNNVEKISIGQYTLSDQIEMTIERGGLDIRDERGLAI